MREALSRRSLPPSSLDIMLASLSENSVKQYNVCLKKWWSFCQLKNIDVYSASIPTIIYFLTSLYNSGSQYGTLNSCRSALSFLLGPYVIKDDRIQRFFKGVFRLRPPLPKYNVTWDTNCVLEHLNSWYPNVNLSLDQLSRKTITLLALTSAHRIQTLSKINIKNIEAQTSQISIKIPDLIKTSRPGSYQPIVSIPFFEEKPSICPAKSLVDYLDRTSPLRQSDNLFIAVNKPHKSVGSQTLSRWIKRTLSECGIDANTFSAYSTRHAATSRAHSLGVNIDAIRNTAGWSGNSNTFAKFYNRVIVTNDNLSLARAIIDDF